METKSEENHKIARLLKELLLECFKSMHKTCRHSPKPHYIRSMKTTCRSTSYLQLFDTLNTQSLTHTTILYPNPRLYQAPIGIKSPKVQTSSKVLHARSYSRRGLHLGRFDPSRRLIETRIWIYAGSTHVIDWNVIQVEPEGEF